MRKEGNKYGIYIESTQPKTAKRLERSVMKVLRSSAGDDVKMKALEVMANALCTHAAITACTIGKI